MVASSITIRVYGAFFDRLLYRLEDRTVYYIILYYPSCMLCGLTLELPWSLLEVDGPATGR